MYNLKYIFTFLVIYIIFRYIYIIYYSVENLDPNTNYKLIENLNAAIGNDPTNGKFIIPAGNNDQTIQTNGYFGRFIRIRPSLNLGDGYLELSQVIVKDPSGNNIALNKPVYTTSKYTPTNTLSGDKIVDGTLTSRTWPNVWHAMTPNRTTEFFEIDLQTVSSISSIQILFRDYQGVDAGRIKETRVEINTTSSISYEKEVYYIGWYNFTKPQAVEECAKYGGTLATTAQLTAVQSLGAQWCAAGWVSDSEINMWPMQESINGCGGPGISQWNPGLAGINCYGVKPAKDANVPIIEFSSITKDWNSPIAIAERKNIALGNDPKNGKFIVPITKTSDNTVLTNGYVGRYIIIRPSLNLGDGYLGISQLIVKDSNGINIAKGKRIYASSIYPHGSEKPPIAVDGTTETRGWPNLWYSASGNRETEFFEIDLGAQVAISSVQILAQLGYHNSLHVGNDRTSQVRISINPTSISTDAIKIYEIYSALQ